MAPRKRKTEQGEPAEAAATVVSTTRVTRSSARRVTRSSGRGASIASKSASKSANSQHEWPEVPTRKKAKGAEKKEKKKTEKKEKEEKTEESESEEEAEADNENENEEVKEVVKEEVKAEEKEEEKAEEPLESADDDESNTRTIVIEHCKQCNSFKTRATQVKDGLEKGVPGITVIINPDKPRRGCFEIREEGGDTFISLLELKRPFKPMKELNMQEVIESIIEKIK